VTLTNRLTLFSLAALGMVLAAFSGTIYVLARTHLMWQLNDRATATLDTLVAAAEVEVDGLEWESTSRRILLRGDGEPPAWAVFDEDGRRIDGSDAPPLPLDGFADAGPDLGQSRVNVTRDGEPWRVVCRTLRHPHPEVVRGTAAGPRYRALVFVTAWPVAPVHGLLRALAWGLGGVSLALWLLAGVAGRWVCRRALTPVRRMTDAAGRITAADPGGRLPVPAARDELHDLAGSFNDLLDRLQDAFERQRRFAGEASHQLRTPLAAMLGQMEVALRRDREPAEYRRALATAVAQAGRLRQIVESLLFLARADADAELPGLEAIDLGAWLGETLNGFTHDRGGDVRLAGPVPAGVCVRAQPALLTQVVGNLIDNACKYSDPGTPVTVSLTVDAGEAVLAVDDAGIGIEAADAARVFEPFFRSACVRRRGIAGVGLGLAVAARVVKAFGGRMEVRSTPGRGSRFSVRMPICPA
jgi:signal transduction histidine kinase